MYKLLEYYFTLREWALNCIYVQWIVWFSMCVLVSYKGWALMSSGLFWLGLLVLALGIGGTLAGIFFLIVMRNFTM